MRIQHPVTCMSWQDAQEYVQWLYKETGKDYRLLSEAEWEYVARAGTRIRYHTGSRISPDQANYNDNNGGTVPVGSYAPNAFGLYDVYGNVSAWVQDCWNEDLQGAPRDESAWEREDCSGRVMRGGSWHFISERLRSSSRIGNDPDYRLGGDGFRVALTLTP